MDTIIAFLMNIAFIILSLIFYYLLSNKGIMRPYKKVLIIIDIAFLIVNMLVLAWLIFLSICAHYFFYNIVLVNTNLLRKQN